MFDYWKKIDELHHINRLLLSFAGILFFIIMGLTTALVIAPHKVEFWLAPEMARNGGAIKASSVPDEYVHGFVATLIPVLNSWEDEKTYQQNIQAFTPYLTPNHQALMHKTFALYQKAQLFERMQSASLYRFMEPSDIKRINQDIWTVHLKLRITQRLNSNNPMVIADKVVDMDVRVVKVNASKLQNPFGLAFDGYVERATTDLLMEDNHAS